MTPTELTAEGPQSWRLLALRWVICYVCMKGFDLSFTIQEYSGVRGKGKKDFQRGLYYSVDFFFFSFFGCWTTLLSIIIPN